MSWVTVIWSMVVSVCLTLALGNALVWSRRREARADALFALLAAATALVAVGELWVMRAETVGEFGRALRWLHLPAWMMIVSLVGFVRLYLRAGRPWLAWAVCGVRTLSLFLNFAFTPNLNYREITAVRHLRFLGESVSVAEGVHNPWMLVGQASFLLLVVFVVDALVTVWRRGDRRPVRLLACAIVFFVVAGTSQTVLALWGIVPMPITTSLFFLGIVAAMGFEMSDSVLCALKLADDLRESEEQMTLAAEAAGVGVWVWNIARNQVWASERWLHLFGFAPEAAVTFEKVIQRIHPDDRQTVEREVRRGLAIQGDYAGEFRVVLPDGTQRWVAVRGRAHPDRHGKPARMLGASIDVTPRKQSEAALKASEERFRHVAETAGEFIWEVDAAGLYTFASASVEKTLGYTPNELVGKRHFYDFFEPSVREEQKAAAFQVFASRQMFHDFPNTNVSKSGRLVHLETSGTPVLDSAGNLVNYRGADTDVTARMGAEQALRESETRYRSIVDGAIEGIYRTSLAGKNLMANPALAKMLGYDSAEEVVAAVQDSARQVWVNPDDRSRFVQLLEEQGTVRGYECQYQRKDGTKIWVSLNSHAVRGPDGQVAYFDGFIEDISERKQAQAAMRESAERLRQAAEAAEFGAYKYDFVTGEAFYSPEFLALYGLPADGKIELDSNRLPKAVHPDDKAHFMARMQAGNDPEGSGIFDAEFRIFRSDGQLRWLRVRGRTEFAGQGADRRPLHASGILQDVTARRQAEQGIEQQRNELAHLSRVNMLGELAGSLAHELNQPLTAILSNAQAAQRFLAHDQVDLNEMRDILADIVAEDKRAGEVIRRLRMLLKKGEVQHQPVNVNKVVMEVLRLMRNDLLNQGVVAQAEFGRDLPIVRGDRVQLQQVLINLVMNACDAMAGTARDARRLAIRTGLAGGDAVRISVADQGAGIAPDKLEQVFEPFYTTKAHGMGLGLAVCRTIITAHGGNLWAVGNSGQGATFHFTLPVVKGEQ